MISTKGYVRPVLYFYGFLEHIKIRQYIAFAVKLPFATAAINNKSFTHYPVFFQVWIHPEQTLILYKLYFVAQSFMKSLIKRGFYRTSFQFLSFLRDLVEYKRDEMIRIELRKNNLKPVSISFTFTTESKAYLQWSALLFWSGLAFWK